ncbi:hypothetical protein [Alkalicoccus saliphilus]|uniref:YtxH domain-containing protein n=1 Tax=Alkalicoccus saliphilus TaxID=200989 RepID=A0A2T4U7J4_9BACI|nr:hypothetical protein [Alkalicoccus saliphilus]PTL39335.1 hypothetical protein C6Y45_06900 [Alkalicoccus saliphilus]
MGKSSKLVLSGTIAGLVAGAVTVASNRTARENTKRFATNSSTQIKQVITLARENREEFVEHLRSSGEKISRVADHASDDMKQLMETSQKMKSHFDEVKHVLQDVNNEWKGMLQEVQSSSKRLDQGQGEVPIEHLPEGGTDSENTEK